MAISSADQLRPIKTLALFFLTSSILRPSIRIERHIHAMWSLFRGGPKSVTRNSIPSSSLVLICEYRSDARITCSFAKVLACSSDEKGIFAFHSLCIQSGLSRCFFFSLSRHRRIVYRICLLIDVTANDRSYCTPVKNDVIIIRRPVYVWLWSLSRMKRKARKNGSISFTRSSARDRRLFFSPRNLSARSSFARFFLLPLLIAPCD